MPSYVQRNPQAIFIQPLCPVLTTVQRSRGYLSMCFVQETKKVFFKQIFVVVVVVQDTS